MTNAQKTGRYKRIYKQMEDLLKGGTNATACMSTITAVLHHKMDYFFWTGFYFLKEGDLVVKSYQGPVACQVLEKNTGVCWAGINREETVIVPDVHQFPGHIACDSRARSEIVIPLRDPKGTVIGVLDVDSKELDSFDAVDAEYLEQISRLIFNEPS
jgi:L-methionine (R)-S-oxide reductase